MGTVGDSGARGPAARSSAKLLVLCVVLGSVLIASPFLLRAFVIEAFKIPSGAMIPTLLIGDHMFTSKWPQEARRGDVVVFRYPLDPSVDYVKRVVAVAGDTIEVTREGVVLNGQVVPRRLVGKDCSERIPEDVSACEEDVWEETIDKRTYHVLQEPGAGHTSAAVAVPEGHVFVMGDNRDNSSDSRVWGFLPIANIKAHALTIWWSQGPHGVRWQRVFSPVR